MRAAGASGAASTIRARPSPVASSPAATRAWTRRCSATGSRSPSPGGAGLDLASSAYRLCWSEADGLPGLVVDRYAERERVPVPDPRHGASGRLGGRGAGGAIPRRPRSSGATTPRPPASRASSPSTSGSARRRPPPCTSIPGARPPGPSRRDTRRAGAPGEREEVAIEEGGCQFSVRLGSGHKTGFYLDQRENRLLVAAHAAGRRMLDAFCYTGAFACHALRAGAARALLVDSSGDALGQAARHLAQNGVADRAELREGNAFDALRALESGGERFGLDRAGSAAVHAAQGRPGCRRSRIQGDQPEGASPARARRPPGDLLVLASRHGRRCSRRSAARLPATPASLPASAPSSSRAGTTRSS